LNTYHYNFFFLIEKCLKNENLNRGQKKRAKKKSKLLVAACECQTQTKLLFTSNSDTIKNIPAMKSVINEIDEINTINNTITELITNNNEKTELNVKTKLDILDHPITVAARECQTQPKLILTVIQ